MKCHDGSRRHYKTYLIEDEIIQAHKGGFKPIEIARLLGIAPLTVKTLLQEKKLKYKEGPDRGKTYVMSCDEFVRVTTIRRARAIWHCGYTVAQIAKALNLPTNVLTNLFDKMNFKKRLAA